MAIVTRVGKGSKLTAKEMDNNLLSLETDISGNVSAITSKLDKGTYTGTAKDLDNAIAANVTLIASKLDKGAYTGTAKDLENAIVAAVTGASGISIVPTSPAPSGTGIASFTATQAGTYTNYGGVVVAANSFAIISRSAAGVFSISQTPLDLTSYAKTVDTDKTKANADAALDSVSIEVVKFSESVGNYMQQDGNLGNHVNSKVIRIPVIAGKKYKLKGQILSPAHFASTFGAYGFFGTTAGSSLVTGSLVLGASTSTEGTVPVLYDLIVTAPVGANYIFITQRISVDNMTLNEFVKSSDLKVLVSANTVNTVVNSNSVNDLYSLVTIPVTPTYNNGFLIPNYLYPEANALYRISQYPVVAGKIYRLNSQLTTGAGNGAGIYCFYNTINGPTAEGLTLQTQNLVKSYDTKITIPTGVTYLMVTEKLTGGDFSIVQEVVSTPALKSYTDSKIASIQDGFDSLALVSASNNDGLVLWTYNNAINNANYRASFFPVVAGKKYRIKGQYTTPDKDNANIAVYSFYTSTNYASGISGSLFNQKTVVVVYDVIVTAPATANFIGLNQKIGVDNIVITQVVDLSLTQIDVTKAKSDILISNALITKNFDYASKSILSTSTITSQFIQLDGNGTTNADYKIMIFPVVAGQDYKIQASITSPASQANNPIGSYCFFNGNTPNTPIVSSIQTQPATTIQSTIPKTHDVVLTAPATARFIRVTQKTGTDTVLLSGVIYASKLESDLSKAVNNNITFWGDSITWGAAPANGRYFTLILKEMLPLYNIINCGVGGESAVNIPARQGALPVYNSLDFTIPTDTSLVPVGRYDDYFYSGFFKSSYDDNSGGSMLLQGEGRDYNTVNPCFVDNIECTMSYVSEATNPTKGQYYIKRNVAGASRVIKAGTKLFTNAAKTLKQGATVLFMGTNDGWIDTADLIARYKKMVEFSGVRNNFVIIGIYGGTAKTNKNLDKAAFELMEKAFSREFGLHYINLRKYAVEKGLSDAGITPTQADTDAIALGFCPPSLIPDGIHPGSEFSIEIADLIYATLKNLGVV
jgi:hypothetical protein